MNVYEKRNPSAPQGFFACEAAGLRWLAEAPSGARCVEVLDHDRISLTLERLVVGRPERPSAHAFGKGLAYTHDAGASAFGASPDGWTGPAFFGPMSDPLPMSTTEHATWGQFYADERIGPMLELAAAGVGAGTAREVEAVLARCRAGDFDDDDRPARLHGDLWSGNLMWTPDGAVLIDPAAHGGHRETDLAMLALFGAPFLDDVVAGYESVHPLRARWRQRVGLHQLYPLLAHVALFGSGYVAMVRKALRDALAYRA